MNPKVILLVEDNISDIELTTRAFNRAHIANELIVVEDGEEALDYLLGTGKYAGRDIRQLPALVLLDLNLPKIDGFQVLRRIRATDHTHRMPVVILTSSSEEHDIAAGYDHGANSYIRKPVNFDRFAEVIQHLGMYWLVMNEPPPQLT